MLGAIPQLDVDKSLLTSAPMPDLSPELQQVMATLTLDAMPFDRIVQQTGLAAGLVSSALLQLELMGLVSQLPGMRYQRYNN